MVLLRRGAIPLRLTELSLLPCQPMQTGVGSLNLAQVVGSLAAGALVLGGFWGLFWLKRRRREARNERPPQREKVLRPAGYSAICRAFRWQGTGIPMVLRPEGGGAGGEE